MAFNSGKTGAQVMAALAKADGETAITYTGGDGINYSLRGANYSASAPNFNFGVETFAGVNLPGSALPNSVFSMGWNIGANGAPEVAGRAALRIAFEEHYLQGGAGPAAFEWHLSCYDESGVEHRPITAFLHKDGSPGSDLLLQADRLRFNDYNGAQMVNMSFTSKFIDLVDPALVIRTPNNAEVFTQQNAAGTAYLAMPRIDTSNHWRSELPITILNSASVGAIGVSYGIGALTSGCVNNGYHVLFEATNDVSGVLNTAFKANAANYDVQFASTRAAGKVRFRVDTSAGDGLVGFWSGASAAVSMGLHHSSGEFRICPEFYALGGAQAIRLRLSDGRTEFAAPVKLPSYTVATLPSASTMGAGAQAFCSNESGGAVPVFSDGTDWRRVTDRAIVS